MKLNQEQIDIAAARLAAGYFDANDTDDDIEDPIVGKILLAWCGLDNMPRWTDPVMELYEAITSDSRERP